MGTAPRAPQWGLLLPSPSQLSPCVAPGVSGAQAQRRMFLGLHRGAALPVHPGYSTQNNPQSPPAWGATKHPVQHPLPHRLWQLLPPRQGSPMAGAPRPEGVHDALRQHKPALSLAPRFIAARGSGCARLLAATPGSRVGGSGHTPAPSPRTHPALPDPVTPLGADRDSVRAPQGIHVLVNPRTAWKSGGVFHLESSAPGRWEQRCCLRDLRSQSHPWGHPVSRRRRWEPSPPAHGDAAKQLGGWSQLPGGFGRRGSA